MSHLALPYMDDTHLWLSEGLAVYVESIARVQSGDLPTEKIWAEFVRDMPKGLPGDGDNGLDYTHSWGRTYWGGAIFCLLADVEFRRQTGNKRGLQDALRGVVAAGGSLQIGWPIERVLAVADKAAGAPALSQLYQSLRATPGEFGLPKERLLAWIEKSATAVAIYYGRFPVASARILIVPVEGRGVHGGQAFGYGGAAVR